MLGRPRARPPGQAPGWGFPVPRLPQLDPPPPRSIHPLHGDRRPGPRSSQGSNSPPGSPSPPPSSIRKTTPGREKGTGKNGELFGERDREGAGMFGDGLGTTRPPPPEPPDSPSPSRGDLRWGPSGFNLAPPPPPKKKKKKKKKKKTRCDILDVHVRPTSDRLSTGFRPRSDQLLGLRSPTWSPRLGDHERPPSPPWVAIPSQNQDDDT